VGIVCFLDISEIVKVQLLLYYNIFLAESYLQNPLFRIQIAHWLDTKHIRY